MATLKETSFARNKERVLDQKTDLSRKGSIDQPIVDLVAYINSLDSYYTTSSCSGRIILFSESTDVKKKKGCQWLLTSHSEIEAQQLASSLTKEALVHSTGYVYLKFEAFVIHVACKDISYAQKMLQHAVSAGFRNSGISIGSKGKSIVGVRSTHSLQTPVAHNQAVLVTDEYLEHLVHIVNHKMRENLQRIQRFFETLQTFQAQSNPVKQTRGVNNVTTESRPHHQKSDIAKVTSKELSSDDELHDCITELLREND